MVRHDLECRKCGHREEDFMFMSHKTLHEEEKAEVCPGCGEQDDFRITLDGSSRIGQIATHNSEMYGKPWPSFGGEVVRDYTHKQELLRKYNMIEAGDPVGGSREPDYPPGYNGPGRPSTPSPATEVPDNVMWDPSKADMERAMEDEVKRLQSGGDGRFEAVEDSWE